MDWMDGWRIAIDIAIVIAIAIGPPIGPKDGITHSPTGVHCTALAPDEGEIFVIFDAVCIAVYHYLHEIWRREKKGREL